MTCGFRVAGAIIFIGGLYLNVTWVAVLGFSMVFYEIVVLALYVILTAIAIIYLYSKSLLEYIWSKIRGRGQGLYR